MARKIAAIKTPARNAAPVKPVASTPVRNSPIPKAAAAAAPSKTTITQEMIAIRAFEISCGPNCGSEQDNWYRAERELRGV